MAGEIEAAAVAATAQLAQMTADFGASPEQKAAAARARLAELDGDVHHVGRRLTSVHARQDIESLEHQLKVAESEIAAANEIAAAAQQVDPARPQTTADQQNSTLAAAIADDLHLGIAPDLVHAFHVFGQSTDRLGHVAGE